MPYAVVTLDIGGTLGSAPGPRIAACLANLSPHGPQQARKIMRDLLHTAAVLTPEVIAAICKALDIAPSEFPRDITPAPLVLYPGTRQALAELSRTVATVVTLSNVTCADADPSQLASLVLPGVSGHFPSYRTGFAKPDRRAFESVTGRYSVPASRVIHVGDDWECDVQGATAAGSPAVWISRGRPVPDEQFVMEHHVRIATDFPQAVRSICRLLTRSIP